MNKSDIYSILSLKCVKMSRDIPKNNFWKIYGEVYNSCRFNNCSFIKAESKENYPKSVIDFCYTLLPFIDKIDEEEYKMIGLLCLQSNCN
jgi:hypothetical protein